VVVETSMDWIEDVVMEDLSKTDLKSSTLKKDIEEPLNDVLSLPETSNKTVFAWGNTINGELGLGGIEEEHINKPTRLEFTARIKSSKLIQGP